MDSQLGEWRCCDVATGTPPSDSTRTTRTPLCGHARGRAADTPAKLAKRYEPLMACGPAAQQGPRFLGTVHGKTSCCCTALVALLSVSNETKAQVYDCDRRGCAALPAGQTVKREGGFNSQRKIVPMSNNQQSEKRKK